MLITTRPKLSSVSALQLDALYDFGIDRNVHDALARLNSFHRMADILLYMRTIPWLGYGIIYMRINYGSFYISILPMRSRSGLWVISQSIKMPFADTH